MSEEVQTHYVKGGYSTVDDVVLSATKTTRIVFRPAVHGSGVRGEVIRQKVGSDGNFVDSNEVNFRTLPADCGVKIELDTDAVNKLTEKIEQLRLLPADRVPVGDSKWIVARPNEVLLVDDKTKARAIRELLSQGHTEQFWNALTKSDPDLATRLAIGQIQLDRHAALTQFNEALSTERDNEAFWQSFFGDNPWMLQAAFSAPVFLLAGDTYVGGKRAINRQGKGGVATDFLFADASTKSFAVVEIKTPKTPLIGGVYRGERDVDLDNETYSMSAALSGAVVQTRNQIAVAIDDFASVLGKTFDTVNRVHPKGVLVVGTASALGSREKDSFNHFRSGLFSLTVITFDEVLHRLCLLYDFVLSEPASNDFPW